MNEEQPNFKVTDRRLFNADGSPRELPPEEKPEPKAPIEHSVPPAAVSTEKDTLSGRMEDHPIQPEPDFAPEVADAADTLTEEELSPEDLADAQDPASFVNFLMSIASNAASALGMIEHPVTHQRDVDLELGKHWIDVLGMLQKKTQGNLTAQEHQMMDGLLGDLRMQYVSLTNAPRKRAFSGKDLTGGR